MRKSYHILLLAILCASCAKESLPQDAQSHPVELITSISSFENEENTKVNLAGNAFVTDDWVRMKIICPNTLDMQNGESTPSEIYDGFWMMKWTGSAWTNMTASDGCDLDGDFIDSDADHFEELRLSQGTPYIFTATTWTEEISFVDDGVSGQIIRPYLQFNNVFQANQSLAKYYCCSDVLWAQYIMQTGTWRIYLDFQHVMSALEIHVSDASSLIASDAVLTIEGMPDMDQQEVVVGDYYAAASKVNSSFGYKEKCSCTKDKNGKVLGISYIDQTTTTAGVTPIEDLPRTGVYKAYNAGGKVWKLIVPPCSLSTDAVIWLRSGNRRYSLTLEHPTFEQGKLYPITMKIE